MKITINDINLKITDTKIEKWKLLHKLFPIQKVKAQKTRAIDKKSQLALIVASLNTTLGTAGQKAVK